jgi:DNA invertase Pin-like site-specific DNA recombinase
MCPSRLAPRRSEPVSEINVAEPRPLEGYATLAGMGHLLGYARISTGEQHPDLQVDALKGAGCYRVFVDTASGALAARPALDQLLDQLRPGDTLVVWKLDRLGRSLRHLVDTIAALADRGVGFRSLQEQVDTTTPGGKLVFHIFAALAEFERDLIRERTSAGMAAARARGRTGGRPAVMTEPKIKLAREMYTSRQYTVAAIASALGVSRASIYRHLGGLEG